MEMRTGKKQRCFIMMVRFLPFLVLKGFANFCLFGGPTDVLQPRLPPYDEIWGLIDLSSYLYMKA